MRRNGSEIKDRETSIPAPPEQPRSAGRTVTSPGGEEKLNARRSGSGERTQRRRCREVERPLRIKAANGSRIHGLQH
ncbi:hypothetical protein NDU88_004317 [Pleurodeles waltl]|uniref:Uncharacterized protein n=1 Tax=Pleurodeles waltl TaxID=8319 RepID=A0AAV7SII7_PLEWA|nr:hypothetical protein NDU88_004317 [Pleurodeles waltl]